MNSLFWVLLAYATLLMGAWLVLVEAQRLLQLETRGRLFALRDELFELGKSGTIPFESEGYRFSEGMLNSMIRFTHDLSFARLLIGVLIAGSSRRRNVARFKALSKCALDSLNPEGQKAFQDIQSKSDSITASHIVKSSLVLLSLAGTAMIVFVAAAIVYVPLKVLSRSLIRHMSTTASQTKDPSWTNETSEVGPSRATAQVVTFTLRKTKVLRQADVEAMFNSGGLFGNRLVAA